MDKEQRTISYESVIRSLALPSLLVTVGSLLHAKSSVQTRFSLGDVYVCYRHSALNYQGFDVSMACKSRLQNQSALS